MLVAWVVLAGCAGPRGRCGEGTVKLDGSCVLEDDPIQCGTGTLERDGICEPTALLEIDAIQAELPVPAGTTAVVSQAFHGSFSHTGWQTFAVDFVMDEGSPINAAREGVVVGVKEDSNEGCGDASCADLANYIRIDHGDGTFADYLHLERDGADVEVGETVGTGQPIGRSGNTGWSTGPHLHLAVRGADGRTIPVRFEAFGEISAGQPYSFATATSTTLAAPASSSIGTSSCPVNTYASRGVLLGEGFPCSVVGTNTAYSFTASLEPGYDLLVHRFSPAQNDWVGTCFASDTDGQISDTLAFPASEYTTPSTFLQMTSVPGGTDCDAWPGWESSTTLNVYDVDF